MIVLTIGRMAPMPIPEQMLPWQVIGDGSGEPLEWSERITLEEKPATARAMRFVTDKITNQFKHYTVEHDESPPTELQEQHAAAQKIKTQLEHDHSGLSDPGQGVVADGGRGSERRRGAPQGLDAAGDVLPAHHPQHEHGQYQLLREFIPGQRQANIAHARRMSVYDVASMAAVGDRIGDRTGLIVGQTARSHRGRPCGTVSPARRTRTNPASPRSSPSPVQVRRSGRNDGLPSCARRAYGVILDPPVRSPGSPHCRNWHRSRGSTY
ncbi:hypothetical protein GCM10020255_008390 [Rhodococcus baikonurensis]